MGNNTYRVVLLLTTLASVLLPSGNSQVLQTLPLKLQEHQVFPSALDHYSLEEELDNAQDVLQKLWTVYLPELWQNKSKQLSQGCMNSVDYLMEGLKENSSNDFTLAKVFPLLDAAGKQGAGLLTGNLILDGAYDECFNYNYTGYCLAYPVNLVKKTKAPLMWRIGLCVPKYCNNHDLSVVINHTLIFQVSEDAIKCEDSKLPKYSTGAIAMVVVTMVFVVMVVVGTVSDISLQCIPFLLNKNYDRGTVSVNATSYHDPENVPLLARSKVEKLPDGVKPWDFITAFSLFKTVPTLLATKQAPSVITSLNGLRVISMFWVILGHTYYWFLISPWKVDNPIILKGVLSRFSFQVVENAFLSVDSFFFLSGVLVAYLSLREMKRKNGRFPFLHFYIHRYLRLTPTYAFVLFFAWALFTHMAYSPDISLGGSAVGNCKQYWWTNLLYINNFLPWKTTIGDSGCFGWGWYLANDMQFYIISPLIVIPLYYFFPLALIIVAVLLLCSFIVTATLVGVYDYQSISTFANIAYNYTINLNGPQYFDLVYVKPWSRIPPYLVGLVLGYLLFKGFRLSFGWKKNVIAYLILWTVAGIILFPDVYGLYFTWHGHVPGKFENVVYLTFSRFAWGIGLAVIVFSCHNGYGWFINSFLSMKMWTPLARMTFNAYLVHPVVLTVIYGQLQKSFHYTDITVAFFHLSFVVLSYGIAGAVCLLVEFPLATIEMLVFKMVGMDNRASQRQVTVMGYNEEKRQENTSTKDLFTKTEV